MIMSKFQSCLMFVCALSCLCITAVNADQLYKWVDDQGHVHYTQTPPPSAGTKAKAVNLEVARADATAAAAAAAAIQQSKDAQTKKDQTAQDEAAEIDKEAAIREKVMADQAPQQEQAAHLQYCQSLQSKLDSAEHADDALTPRQRGERKYSDDAAKQKKIDDIKAQIRQQC
jgi:hypothetical protein